MICICSFGYFTGVKLQLADVSEPCVSSIFKGWMQRVSCEGKQGNLYPCQGLGLELAGPMGDVPHQVVGGSG